MLASVSFMTKLLKRLWGETDAIGLWVLSWAIWPVGLRTRVLNLAGAKLHPSVRIFPDVHIIGRRLSIGELSFVNTGCHLDCCNQITIGRDVHLSPRVSILTATHELEGAERRAGQHTSAPVTIGDGAWLGAGATILPGITIGAGAVIAAGAVVAEDCEPNTLYGGVPAKPLRTLAGGDDTFPPA